MLTYTPEMTELSERLDDEDDPDAAAAAMARLPIFQQHLPTPGSTRTLEEKLHKRLAQNTENLLVDGTSLEDLDAHAIQMENCSKAALSDLKP